MSTNFNAPCHFETIAKENGTFVITATTQGGEGLALNGSSIYIELQLAPGTTMADAEQLAELLRDMVTHVGSYPRS